MQLPTTKVQVSDRLMDSSIYLFIVIFVMTVIIVIVDAGGSYSLKENPAKHEILHSREGHLNYY